MIRKPILLSLVWVVAMFVMAGCEKTNTITTSVELSDTQIDQQDGSL